MSNPFDDISENEWKQPVTMGSNKGSNPFDEISPHEWQSSPAKPARKFSLGSVVNDLAGAVNRSPLDEMLRPAVRAKQQQDSFDYNGPMVGPGMPPEAAARQGRGILTKLAAAGSGVAGLADTALNAPRWLVNRIPEGLGHPEAAMPYSHLQQDYNNLPGVYDLRKASPEFFDQYSGVTQAVAPVPTRAGELLGVVGKPLTRVADAALTQGVLGGANAINAAVQKGQNPTAQDLAMGAAGGALLGGAAHGLVEGVGAASRGAGKVLQGIVEKRAMKAAARPQTPEQAATLLSRIEKQIADGQIDMQDPEVAAAISALREQLAPPAPVAGELSPEAPKMESTPPQPSSLGDLAREIAGPSNLPDVSISPFQLALAKVRNASPATLDAAIQDATKAIPKGAPKTYRKTLKAQIDQAYSEYLARQQGGSPAAQNPLSLFGSVQETQVTPKPQVIAAAPRSLSDAEMAALVQKEHELFPGHKGTLLTHNRGKGYGFSERVQPQVLDDTQLQDAIDYVQATRKMSSVKPHEKTRAREEEQALMAEKMRREYRKANNLPEDWTGGKRDLKQMSKDELGELVATGDENDPYVHAAVEELIGRNSVKPVMGNFRKQIPKNAEGKKLLGYDQASEGVTLASLPESSRADAHEHMLLTAKAKEIEFQLEELNKDIYKMLGGSGTEVKHGQHWYKPNDYDTVLNTIGEALKNKVVDALAHGVKPEVKYTMRGIAENPASWVEKIDPTTPVEQLDTYVTQAKEALKEVNKVLEQNRPHVAKLLPDQPVSDVIDLNGKAVRVSLRKVSNQMQRDLDANSQKVLKAWENRILSLEKYTKSKEVRRMPGRRSGVTARVLLNTTGGILTATSPALAADGKMSEEDRKVGALQRAAGFFLIAGGNIVLAKKLLSSRAMQKAVAVWEDTLGHAERLDEALGLRGKDGLFWTINEHNAAAAMAAWGVKFDSQNAKAEALSLLNSKLITPQQALDPVLAKGTAFEHMNRDQKAAVIAYWANRKTLAQKVRKYNDRLDLYLKDPALTPQQRADFESKYGASRDVVSNLNVSLNSQKPKTAGAAKALMGLNGNAMDAYFMWNPQFHALNMLDSVIMGTFGFGTKRMMTAQIDMVFDRELRSAMADSNLFGNYRAERQSVAGMALPGKGIGQLEDLGSDVFNANRVALMAWSEYFDINRAAMAKAGFNNYRDFVKALLQNKVDPTIQMDAWVHMMERTNRFLGVDPLKANPNAVQANSPIAAAFLSFTAQPLRVARLIGHYARKGDKVALLRFLRITTLLGGSAAVPKTIQWALEYADPDTAQTVETFLDSISIPGLVANNIPGASGFVPSISDKSDYDPFVPVFGGAMGVGVQNAVTAGKNTLKTFEAAQTGDPKKIQEAGYKAVKGVATNATSGLPVGEAFRLGEDIQDAVDGTRTFHNYYSSPLVGDKRVGGGDIDLDKLPGGRALPLVDHVAPGIPAVIYQSKKAEQADFLAKRQKLPGRLQLEDVNLGGVKVPLSWRDPLAGMVKK